MRAYTVPNPTPEEDEEQEVLQRDGRERGRASETAVGERAAGTRKDGLDARWRRHAVSLNGSGVICRYGGAGRREFECQ